MSVISGLTIPKQKIVKIKGKNDVPIIENDLIYDEDLSFKLSSSFGNLWEAHGNNLMTLLSGGSKGKVPSGQFVMQGFQIWQSTEPLSFSLSLKLYSKDNARKDVWQPSLKLAQLCLPMKSKNSNGQTNQMLSTLIPPGPNLTQILKSGGFNNLSDFLAEKTGADPQGTYNIDVGGYVNFLSVIITSANPTFSKQIDGSGYPISATIDLEFTTSEIATTDMISNIM